MGVVGSHHRLSGVKGKIRGGSVWLQHSWWEAQELAATLEREERERPAWRVRYLDWPEYLEWHAAKGDSAEMAQKGWDRASKWSVAGFECVRVRDSISASPVKRRRVVQQ